MKPFSTVNQIEIFLSCNNTVELLEAKELFNETQEISKSACKVFDALMTLFLVTEKITK